MKQVLSLLLALLLTVLATPTFALEFSATMPDWGRLERYSSFSREETIWSVRSHETEAALQRMGSETAPYNGWACFGLELTGDVETGLVVPVLTFYYAGNTALNGRAASIAVQGMRCDFLLFSETIQLGSHQAERLSAPLDAQGIKLIRTLLRTSNITIRLQGDFSFTMTPTPKAHYANGREELSARSLSGLSAMLEEFDALGSYKLWDLNEAWWERTRGVKPAMRIVTLPDSQDQARLSAPMYLLSRGDHGNDVRTLQNLLVERGYLQTTPDGNFGEGTMRAVSAVQQYWGLPATGSADEEFLRLLEENSLPDMRQMDDAPTGAQGSAEGLCEWSISRCWFAQAVESTGGERRIVADRDNIFIIFEGTVRNLSLKELDFYWQLSATARLGDYEYPCVLVCERNEGMTLASSLIPLGEGRLIVFAEVPRELMDRTDWSLMICAEEMEWVFQ